MDSLSAHIEFVQAAAGMPATLDAAHSAFGAVLTVLRHHQEDDEAALPAFVLAANAAATGRDWIADAPSLPPSFSPQPRQPDLLGEANVTEIAAQVTALSSQLARRLAALAVSAADPGDRGACLRAAGQATVICDLLGGATAR